MLCHMDLFYIGSVEMRAVVSDMLSTGKNFWEAFIGEMKRMNPLFASNFAKLDGTAKVSSLRDLFDSANSNVLFDNRRVVLICDEIDSIGTTYEYAMHLYAHKFSSFEKVGILGALDYLAEGRIIFLTDLVSLKNTTKSLHCLQAVIGITNWVGRYLNSTIGHSPFNIRQHMEVPYFTKEKVLDLAQQWENQEDAKINSSITDSIFELSHGAPGVAVMLFKYYVERLRARILKQYDREPTYGDWYSECLTSEFWENISSYANFERMEETICMPTVRAELVKWILNRDFKMSSSTTNTLIKTNVFRKSADSIGFASPLVERFVHYNLSNTEVEKKIPLCSTGVDVVQLLCNVVKCMNRLEIVSRAKSKKQNHLRSTLVTGVSDEEAHVLEFNRILQKITGTR